MIPPSGIGCMWRKWDLHVHTPASLVHHYPGSDPWDAFLEGLASLPPEISVVGINDYLFVDGFARVKAEFNAGRLRNLEQVFPVVELRLDNFVGTEGHWNKVNVHVLFSESLDSATIQGQFLNGLSTEYQLSGGAEHSWSGLPNRNDLEKLGRSIREATPTSKKSSLPTSDILLGFNNLVVGLDQIKARLESTALRGKALIAVGKAEWEQMRWNLASIASKKHVINSADFSFTASQDPASFARARDRLREQKVRSRLLDCSDAHSLADSDDKDRLGNCMTWLNAEPTFQGLRHALTEYDHRVYVGSEPPKRTRYHNRPETHLSTLQVRRTGRSVDSQTYFDVEIPINPGFVAIVGNKGKGKSALLDIVGHVGASDNHAEFSFLTKRRFRNPRENLAADYDATIVWADGSQQSSNLASEAPDREQLVTYLPQNLIETVCAVEPGDTADRFTDEIESVLFSHVPVPERLGATSLQDLVRRRSTALKERLAALRTDLASINEQIVSCETDLAPSRQKALNRELREARGLLEQHIARMPQDQADDKRDGGETEATAASETTLADLRQELVDVGEEREQLERELAALADKLDKAEQLATAARTHARQHEEFMKRWERVAGALELDLSSIASLEIDHEALATRISDVRERKLARLAQLEGDTAESVNSRRDRILSAIESVESSLTLAARERAEAKAARVRWEERKKEIEEGSPERPGIAALRDELERLQRLPDEVSGLKAARLAKAQEIHEALEELLRLHREMYSPALDFIRSHPVASEAELEFGAVLDGRKFEERWWKMIGRNVRSSFVGKEDGSSFVDGLVESTDYGDFESVAHFLTELDDALHYDVREASRPMVDPLDLTRTGYGLKDVYDYLYGMEYVEVDYMLQASDVPIERLSPGQKGTLLLMFYLLVDKNDHPLLLDQPDENLDNQTIMRLLVPAIKEAAQRRQIVIITHSPNVAIVADADQLIIADFDGVSFTYSHGAIESPARNVDAVDILEGTWEAYVNRGNKYQKASVA